jgi:anti-sigma factor RsiW
MSHPEYSHGELDVLALYSLGLLERDQRLEVDEHLKLGCTRCESHLLEFRSAAAAFIEHAAPAVVPSVTLRTRVLAVTGISALSSSPDSNSQLGELSRSPAAVSGASDKATLAERAFPEPNPLQQEEENTGSDTESSLVNLPRAYPSAKRVEHQPTDGGA